MLQQAERRITFFLHFLVSSANLAAHGLLLRYGRVEREIPGLPDPLLRVDAHSARWYPGRKRRRGSLLQRVLPVARMSGASSPSLLHPFSMTLGLARGGGTRVESTTFSRTPHRCTLLWLLSSSVPETGWREGLRRPGNLRLHRSRVFSFSFPITDEGSLGSPEQDFRADDDTDTARRLCSGSLASSATGRLVQRAVRCKWTGLVTNHYTHRRDARVSAK